MTNQIAAVGYIRMSTDKQEDSPARQRRDIEALATRQGYRILSWYEDHGLTGTESMNRPEFQRLLSNAKNGKFKAILLSEQSRMSREDIFDAMMHWKILRDAGVKIVTCQRGELDFSNLGGVITAIVDQYGAREESVKLSQRVTSGQRLKALNGQRIGGIVFGYDREIYDEKGKLVRHVHFQDRFRRPTNWTTKMVVTKDKKVVAAIRWAFAAYAEGCTTSEIAREFNRRGISTIFGNAFTIASIKGILRNPAYIGMLRIGKWSRSKFSSVAADGVLEIENAHPAIIDVEIFERVQAALTDRRKHHVRFRKYLLSGSIRCQHCDRILYGVQRKRRRDGVKETFYDCDKSKGAHCPHPSIRTEAIEGFLLEQIRDKLLRKGMATQLKNAIVRAKQKASRGSNREARKLAELRRKIERGTENLALADPAEFKAISNLLGRWREEEEILAERLEAPSNELQPIPEALKVLNRLNEIVDHLSMADSQQLGDAISKTISDISVGVYDAQCGEIRYREYRGEIRFHDIFGLEPILIPDEVLGPRRIWREFGKLVEEAERPLRLKDFCEYLGTDDPSHAAYHIRRAEAAGLVKKAEHRAGWTKQQP